jgi:hypothetical protein
MSQNPWEEYARLQAELGASNEVNDHSWGLEAALDAIVAAARNSEPAPDLETVIASAGRRERHRAYVRRVNAGAFDHPVDDHARLEARIQLARISRALPRDDLRLACHVAVGLEYKAIATAIGGTPGSLRVRMSRVRQALAPLAEYSDTDRPSSLPKRQECATNSPRASVKRRRVRLA